MDLENIPLEAPPAYGKTLTQLRGFSGESRNNFIDVSGVRQKRAGTLQWADLGTLQTCQGVFWSETLQKVIACSGGSVYTVDESAVVTDKTSDALYSTDKAVTFTEDNTRTIIASGGRLIYIDNSTNSTEITNGISPTVATHAVFYNQHIFANDLSSDTNKRRVVYSNIGDSLTWDDTNFFTAELSADVVQALEVSSDFLVVFGTSTIEFWRYTGESLSPVRRVNVVRMGTSAPQSISRIKDTVYFLDSEARVQVLQGGQIQEVPTQQISEALRGFTQIEDCVGSIELSETGTIYHMTFPSENRTFSYFVEGNTWSESTYYERDTETTTYRYITQSALIPNKSYGFTVGGSDRDDKLYIISKDYQDDNGEEIEYYFETPQVDFGSSIEKRSRRLHVRFNRGEGLTDTTIDPTMQVQWRLDGSTTWGDVVDVSLGKLGDREIHTEVWVGESFRSIQFRFKCVEAVAPEISSISLEVRPKRR